MRARTTIGALSLAGLAALTAVCLGIALNAVAGPASTALAIQPSHHSVAPPLPTYAPASTPPTPAVTPTPEPVVAEEPVLRIKISHTMPFSPTLEPPSFDGVWQIVDATAGYPDDPASATTYLLAHARTPWKGHSPGNDWQDLARGDLVAVDGAPYRVTFAEEVRKTDIGDAPIWEHVSGRIVLITCVPQLSGETATHNRLTILEPAT